jgi:hypothetical protein
MAPLLLENLHSCDWMQEVLHQLNISSWQQHSDSKRVYYGSRFSTIKYHICLNIWWELLLIHQLQNGGSHYMNIFCTGIFPKMNFFKEQERGIILYSGRNVTVTLLIQWSCFKLSMIQLIPASTNTVYYFLHHAPNAKNVQGFQSWCSIKSYVTVTFNTRMRAQFYQI